MQSGVFASGQDLCVCIVCLFLQMYGAWFHCMPRHIWQLAKGRRSFVKRTTKLGGCVVSLEEKIPHVPSLSLSLSPPT